MSGHFVIKSKKNLSDMNIGDEISESDFATLCPDGSFVQMEYVPEEKPEIKKMPAHPGIFKIKATMMGLILEPTSFVEDSILSEFLHTENITEKVDCFFDRLHVYAEYGIEIPKRAALLYGPPGTGKSTAISQVIKKYDDGKTFVLVWATDKFDPADVKDLIQSLDFKGVDRMILVAEDIGGVEAENARIASHPSLLSLLDNQEKTFSIPVFILATTNHPDMFLGNLTNRPNRFDDKIEVGYAPAEFRVKLLNFFSKTPITPDTEALISNKKFEKFTPAHIREIIIRAAIHDKTHSEVIKEMQEEIETFEKRFQKPTAAMGLGFRG